MDSIREALTSAIDKAEKPEDAVGATASIGTDEPSDSGPIGESHDDHTADAVDTATDPVSEPVEASAPIAPAEPAAPAPASWTKEERAEWANLPPAAQKAVARRESEMQRAFQASAQARKRAETFETIGNQYKPLLDHYGVSLESVLPPLLATRAALEVGTDGQKAQLVANLCADFGIDLQQLDSALSQRFANGVPQRVQAQPVRPAPQDPRLERLISRVEAAERAQAEQVLAPLTAQPHYEAVRFTMADLIEKARDMGREVDVTQAYDLACRLHGLEVQQAAPNSMTVSQAASTLARARKAASSVSGAPQPTPPRKPGEGSVADEVTALMSGRR